MTTIAFDVDGCLLELNGHGKIMAIREPVRTLIVILARLPDVRVVVWSGAGQIHARLAMQAAGLAHLQVLCMAKDAALQPDICFDDEDASALAKVSIQI
jgi:hypothetical protein